jgi:hypothetical protein
VTLLWRSIERGCATARDECIVFPVVYVAAVAGDWGSWLSKTTAARLVVGI